MIEQCQDGEIVYKLYQMYNDTIYIYIYVLYWKYTVQ